MGIAGKKACSDEEFIRLFKELGSPKAVATALGIGERAVYLRRNNLAKNRKVHLPSNDNPNDYVQRLTLDGFSGTAVIFSDSHWWPGQELTVANRALLEVIKELKPKLVIANGDVFDGARVSRFPRDGWHHQPRMVDELDAVKERMAEIRHAYRGAQHIRSIGNHCLRFDRYLAVNASEAEGLAGLRLADHLSEWQECVSLFVNGSTVVKHRFNGGIHAAYNNTLRAGTNIFTGHTHRLGVTAWGDYTGRRYGCETGALADIGGPQFVYAEDNPTPGCSGFAVATFDRDGRLLYPELCEVIDGVAYFRGQRVVGQRKKIAA